MDVFAYRDVPRIGRRVFRLGLSGTFKPEEAACREALERVQYVFWSPRMRTLTPALRDALARARERYVVATGPLFAYFPGSVRKGVESALRKLLAAPKGWTGPVPNAGDCYRFCLSSPHVDVVLAGPRNAAELRENLAAVDRGPLAPEEMAAMRAFGRAVHG